MIVVQLSVRMLREEWARLGRTSEPLACEASALPLSYAPEKDNGRESVASCSS
jgi:hypothetical protein